MRGLAAVALGLWAGVALADETPPTTTPSATTPTASATPATETPPTATAPSTTPPRTTTATVTVTPTAMTDLHSIVNERLEREEELARNPYAIIPYRPTYILPISYNASMTQPPAGTLRQDLNELEIKYQISFKIPVGKGLLGGSERFYFGYSQVSFWQAYTQGLSSPFRETDYEPELFFSWLMDEPFLGMRQRVFSLGIDHQSNGQTGDFSRSWNRVYAQWTLERHGVLVMFRPWYRLPEHKKTSPNDAMGDDNPDIEKYMGNFELRSFYSRGPHTYGVMLRNNLSTDRNRGAVQFDYTYPLGKQVRGYFQLFNGYGESLLDYNHASSRVSVGILLTDWL